MASDTEAIMGISTVPAATITLADIRACQVAEIRDLLRGFRCAGSRPDALRPGDVFPCTDRDDRRSGVLTREGRVRRIPLECARRGRLERIELTGSSA